MFESNLSIYYHTNIPCKDHWGPIQVNHVCKRNTSVRTQNVTWARQGECKELRSHCTDFTASAMPSQNNQSHDCLLNRLLRRRSKKTSKLRVAGLCAGNSPVTAEFPAQRTSNAENVSISWCHHAHYRLLTETFQVNRYRGPVSRKQADKPWWDRLYIIYCTLVCLVE